MLDFVMNFRKIVKQGLGNLEDFEFSGWQKMKNVFFLGKLFNYAAKIKKVKG